MYHIVIEDEVGNVITEDDSDALVIVYDGGGGVVANTLVQADLDTVFSLVMSLDLARDKLIGRSPLLRFAYKFRRKIVKGVSQVDLRLLNEALRRRMEEENDDE